MDVVAHRGLTEAAVENSLSAVAAALTAGIQLVEVDVRVARDGALFLLHDATLDRTTDASGRLAYLTTEQASHARLRDRLSLPRLEDALDLCLRRAVLCLDVKDSLAAVPLLSVLRRHDTDVEVWSDHESVVTHASSQGLRTALISSGLLPRGIGDFLWRARECGAASVSFYPADLEPHIAAACRHAAMPFLCGTPNDEPTWHYLERVGARAAITDRPLDCLRWLAARVPGGKGVT